MLTVFQKTTLVAALLALSLTPISAQDPTPLLTRPADQLVAVLKSGASQKEKADACRELAVVGTKDAVPALAAMLPDEQLNHMARYALETIPDPAAAAALRDALGQLQGRPLVGVIGSLGVRRDTRAVAPLARFLTHADPDVAQAAARALGKIGDRAAARAIEGALPKAAPANLLAFCEGLFRCAEASTAEGRRDQALQIYQRLRQVSEAPHQVRAGALRGAILTQGKKGLPLLQESLRSDDYILVAAAARAALELPGPETAQALLAGMANRPADTQILVIQTLAKRGDRTALPTITNLAKGGPKPVRLAAIRALPELGGATTVPVLTGLLNDSDRELAQAAQEGLAALTVPEADAAIRQMLTSSDAKQRLTAIELIGRRRMTSSVPALFTAANDAEAAVRAAAVKRIGELAGPNDLPALLDLLDRAKASSDLDALEQAVTTACTQLPKPEIAAPKLTARLPQAPVPQKAALIRVLTTLGGPEALQAVRAAVKDGPAEVRAAAIRALGSWRTVDAAPDLLALARAGTDATERMICLRGYFGWAANPELAGDQRLAMCRQGADLVQSADEKKLLLGALGNLATVDAIALITPSLADSATKEEATAAIVAVSDRLLKEANAAAVAPRLVEPLQQAAQTTGNADLAKRAKDLLQKAQAK